MAKFTLRVRPGTRVEIPDPDPPRPQLPPPEKPGDHFLIIDRELEDKRGNLAGTFVLRGVILEGPDDPRIAFDATIKLDKDVINTQGAIRLSDKEVTFAIVGGTGKYKKARGTVTRKLVGSSQEFTFRVL